MMTNRIGYSALRDKALANLLDCGFASLEPTRLGIDTVAVGGNLQELPQLQRYCREQNVFPIIADYIPTGRTEAGAFQGHAAIPFLGQNRNPDVATLLQPLTAEQRVHLRKALKEVDSEFGIISLESCAYYSGASCTQTLGVYVDISGNIWPCVARNQIGVGRIPLGSIRTGDKPSSIWKDHPALARIRNGFTGACPYKQPLEV